MIDLRQSHQWASYLKSIGWKIEKINNTFIYLKKIPLLGWFIKIQRPEKLNLDIISFVENKYHPFQLSVEPSNNHQIKLSRKLHFKLSNSPSLPTKTLQIDLTKSSSKILKQMSPKTRYNIRLSQKRNIKVFHSKNIKEFANFWRNNFERKRFHFMSQQKNIIAIYYAFDKNAHILFAKKNKTFIAVLLILIHDKTTYYMYAAANNKGRKNFAPTLLTWEAILLAKKKGCKVFDFDGIYDERFPITSWQGFTKFKEGFGGYEVKYPGCYIKTNSIISL